MISSTKRKTAAQLTEKDDAFYQRPQTVIAARRQSTGGYLNLVASEVQTARASRTRHKADDALRIARIPTDVAEYDEYEEDEPGEVTSPPLRRASQPPRNTTQHHDPVTRPARSIRRASRWSRLHPTMHVGIILISLLLLLSIGTNIFSWFVNTWSDPLSYTQTAHKEIVSLRVNGHQDEVHAFLNQSEHLDLLVIPDGDISKAQLIAGPQLYLNAQQVVLTTTHQGSVITVEAHTQRESGIFFSVQPSANWSVDLAAGGGKK